MKVLTSLPGLLVLMGGVSTGAVMLAGAAAYFLRQKPAAWRHFAWLLALFLPGLAMVFYLNPVRLAIPILPSPPSKATPLATPSTGEVAAAVPSSTTIVSSPIPSSEEPVWTFNLWLTGWWLGGTLLLVGMAWSHLRVTRILQRECVDAPDTLCRRLQSARNLFGSIAPVDLRVTSRTKVPFCRGIFRAMIVFPSDWVQWPQERVDMCLAHELAHIKRGDLRAMFIARLACALCWFNPLVWKAAARLQDEAEIAADDLVLSADIKPESYASNLVALVESCRVAGTFQGDALFMARPNRLKLRVSAILDPHARGESPGFARLITLGGIIVFAVAAAMTVRLTAAPPARPNPASRNLTAIKPQDRSALWNEAYGAIQAGEIGVMDSLLKSGLNPNADLSAHSSLLFLAVDENQLEIVKLLLANGADVHKTTSWGHTPFRRACWRGNRAIADLLITRGAVRDELLYAVGMGDLAALQARDKIQPVSSKAARDVITCAVVAGRQNTFDWLWKKLGGLDEKEKESLLGQFFEKAAEWGQPGMVRHLQILGVSMEKHGPMAMVKAASRNFPQAVKVLLEAGVSPDATPPRWNRALRDAAGEGNLEVVRLLLDHGAEINAQDGQGFTPLSWAAYNGKSEICLLLLERGADGNITDNDGRNAAWHAAGGAHCPEALEVLIKKGVNLQGTDKHGMKLMNAIMHFVPPRPGKIGFPGKVYSETEMKEYDARERRTIDLLVAAGADFQGQPGTKTPLMSALETGHHAAARVLLGHQADVSLTDEQGNTALYWVFNSSPLPVDIFERILKLGKNPNPEISTYSMGSRISLPLLGEAISYAANLNYETPLIREAVKILLANGATFPQVESAEARQLLQAAARGDLPAIQAAIKQGASINATDEQSWCALAITVALGYDHCTEWLIQNGAEVDLPLRRRALDLAIQRDRTDLAEQLIAKGAVLNPDAGGLFLAVQQNNQRLFDLLMEAGADAKTGGRAWTISADGKKQGIPETFPLYSCIKNGNAQMARTLLEKGADPDPANLRFDRSLLFYAVEENQPEIVRALIERGANPLAKDFQGQTPLDLAQKSQKHLVPLIEEAVKHAKLRAEN